MTRTLLNRLALIGIFCLASLQSQAITRSLTYHSSTLSTATNSETTIEKHTSAMTMTTAYDYVITATGSAMTANIDIANEGAAVVFKNIKPATVISSYLKYIKINGAAAVNGTNCRVEIYRHGSIVLPYGNSCHPLVTYKGTGCTGDSKSDWNINDYYTSLGEWDNAIQSFTLKRGYMVTMANHSDGTGYSHCFIADKGDITVTLPKDMLQSVSFLRIFRWNWPSKKGYAGKDETPMGLMNVTWFYQWNAESYDYRNYDYVPQRHKENGTTYSGTATWAWPVWSTINALPNAHVLGQNEPDNTSGSEMYMKVEDLITHHKDFLTSGMRIGTFACTNPNSSWVSDYVSRCEALNYRVDFVATHYYIGGQSPSSCINSLKALYTATKLPVWCTEWNNGASWTTETGFTTADGDWYTWGSGDDYTQNGKWLTGVLALADNSDNTEWMERFAVYNDVEQKRFVHWKTDDHWTTAAGALYGAYQSDFAYNKTTDVWMDWQSQGEPNGLSGGYSLDGTEINLMWNEPNGDWIKTIYIQQNTSGNNWTTRATLGASDNESRTATLTTSACSGTKKFRIRTTDPNGTTHTSNTFDLSTNAAPNGLLKLISIPENYDDYYYYIYSKTASNLCWTLDNATLTDETDYTSSVGTAKASWTGASGTYSGYSVTTATGASVNPVELYNSSAAGTKISQAVSVPTGYYTVVMCATSHNARGENGATLNGTRDDVAYVFATTADGTKKTYFTASGVTPGLLSGEPHECTIENVKVTDGSLTIGLGLDVSSITGWHTLQIKSLTRTGDIEGTEAVSTNMAIHYAAPSTVGTDLGQAWQLEANGNGYALRSPSYPDYVLLGSDVQTNGSTHTGGNSCYLPEYNSTSDYWTVKYVTDATYLGLNGSTPTSGAQVGGSCTSANADKLYLYAIKKVDFNQKYIVDEGNTDAGYIVRNLNFTWGASNGVPAEWTLTKTTSGGEDITTSDGVFNGWAATISRMELYQSVKKLPNGTYRISAEAGTDVTDGSSTVALYGAPSGGNVGRSEEVTTKNVSGNRQFGAYDCYVEVVNNQLTIGIRSDSRYYQVRRFALEYVPGGNEAETDASYLRQDYYWGNKFFFDATADKYANAREVVVYPKQKNQLIKTSSTDLFKNKANLIVDGTCHHLVITDEQPLTIPSGFTAATLTYNRTDAANEWHELFVPFAVPTGDGLNVGTVTSFTNASAEEERNDISNASFESGTAVTGNNTATASGNNAAVDGWTGNGPTAWSVSALFAYGSGAQLNGSAIPASGPEGSSSTQALGISVGWSGSVIYSQTLSALPAGDYTLSVMEYNAGSATQLNSRVGVIVGETSTLSSKTSFALGAWERDAVNFTLDEPSDVTIQIGAQAINNTSTNNAKVLFDDIVLTRRYDTARIAQGLQVAATSPNVPSLIKFTSPSISLTNVAVVPTAEYNDSETGLHGIYTAGHTFSPLRWYVDTNHPLSDFTLNITLPGDVEEDGILDLLDVVKLAGILANGTSGQYDLQVIDVDGNGHLSLGDITALVNLIRQQ